MRLEMKENISIIPLFIKSAEQLLFVQGYQYKSQAAYCKEKNMGLGVQV